MPQTHTPHTPKKRRLPILARHAISLSLVFVIGLLLSYLIGQVIYQQIQLDKLTSSDPAEFSRGVGYVVTHAAESESVQRRALEATAQIDPSRAGDVLLAVAQSHAKQGPIAIPQAVTDAIAPLMQRMTPTQAIGLYDGLVQIQGIDPVKSAKLLLANLQPQTDRELLQVVDLLEARLLWSRQWAPTGLWVRWLSVIAESQAELTQLSAAKRLGELPEAVDDARITAALAKLAQSRHDTVRAATLHAAAGYAALAEDPTDYEQIIFTLGSDTNKIIARRAWMVVGHLNPLSGFAVNWKDADPFVAEAMLWAAVKTNPENTAPAWQAYDLASTRPISLQALGLLRDNESIQRFEDAYEPTPVEQIQIDPERLITYLTSAPDTPPYLIPIACTSLLSNESESLALGNRLLRMNQPMARIVGAILAAMNQTRPKLIADVTAEFLREHPDLTNDEIRAMSDEELAEHGLRRVDALTALLDAAEAAPPSAGRQSEAKLLRLALWMRGDLGDDFTPRAEAMLFDDDLPTSTVLMALLHMQRPMALDYLFGDLVTPRPDLHKLFVAERYWHVFRRFVDTSGLTLWLWGDAEAQAFQLDAMRQWYAVNRWRIERGWWPTPGDTP